MIEAVGEQFWPKYFSQLRDRLLPGGLAGIQAITIQDSLFQTYRREVDFIQRYVFPGGMLPSPQILKSLGERFGVPVIRERIFGQDYARTLAIWRRQFPRGLAQPDAARASTTASGGCGNITSPIARPDSCPEISTSARWCSPKPADRPCSERWLVRPAARSFRVAQRLGKQTGNFKDMTFNKDVVDAIGNTPLIKLKRASEADRLHHSRQGRIHESRPVGQGPRRQMDDPGSREARRAQARRPRGGSRPPAIPASAWRWSPARAAIAR